MKHLCILMSALLLGCSMSIHAKKSKAVEEGMPESLPMRNLDSVSNPFSVEVLPAPALPGDFAIRRLSTDPETGDPYVIPRSKAG